MDPLEVAGVVTGVVAVWLTTRENSWCWPIGLVNVLLFSVVFFRTKLYADAGLQVIYAVLCVYGWWSWLHGGREGGALTVSRTPVRVGFLCLAAGTVAAGGLGFLLRHGTDASFPFWDAATASGSLVAQFLQTRKWIENWIVWILVDAVYLGMYIAKDLRLTAALYAGFLFLAVLGWRSWSQSLARSSEAS